MKKYIIVIASFIFFLFPSYISAVDDPNIIDVEYDGKILDENEEAIFYFDDLKPGDEIKKDIKVKNVSVIAQLIKISCKEMQSYKDLDEIMQIVISVNSTTLYEGTLRDFCTVDAPLPTYLDLTIIPSGSFDTYKFYFYFPQEAGNEYQQSKYVFNLYFEPSLPEGDHIVINEVYYHPDKEHGVDIKNCCGDVNAEISNNAAYSRNIINIQISNKCFVIQENMANIVNNINISSNTGGNNANKNTGSTNISTGIAGVLARIKNKFNYNVAFGACSSVNAQNDEWVELFNPTGEDVSLKDWGLIDNSGIRTTIKANKIIKSGKFALISKNAQTWTYWNEPKHTLIVEVGRIIGNGLDNDGDHLFLVNPDDVKVDATAWQNDINVWKPAVVDVAEGHSIERKIPGYDNDIVGDWYDNSNPSPGE